MKTNDEDLFRVTALIRKRSLGDVLIALEGKAVGTPDIARVVNVAMQNGKATAPTSGKSRDMLAADLASFGAQIRTPEVADWLEKHGKSRLSASSVLAELVKARVLRGHGASSSRYYTVIGR